MREIRPRGAALMLWSTGDTVMIGANQVAMAEFDMAYVRSAGIEIVRRPSGGGAIFTDEGALQYTVILPWGPGADAGVIAREWLAKPAIETIAAFGAEASLEGRNDIMVGGKKVSGLAQHIQYGYICSHGSLLLSADLGKLAGTLTADAEKIKTKAISSVRARVANISDYLPEAQDIARFREGLIKSYAGRGAVSSHRFGRDETGRIEEIVRGKYGSDEWTFGRSPAFTFTNKKRFPGGSIEVFLEVRDGLIRDARITGDFLALHPVAGLEEQIKGVPHTPEALAEALGPLPVGSFLGTLGAGELLEVLCCE